MKNIIDSFNNSRWTKFFGYMFAFLSPFISLSIKIILDFLNGEKITFRFMEIIQLITAIITASFLFIIYKAFLYSVRQNSNNKDEILRIIKIDKKISTLIQSIRIKHNQEIIIINGLPKNIQIEKKYLRQYLMDDDTMKGFTITDIENIIHSYYL